MKNHLLAACLIVFVSLAIYSNTLKNDFVYDDRYSIVENRLIKDLNNIPILFSKSYFIFSEEMSYRPVVTFTYFIDYAIYGMEPWGYHLTNILLHAINGILLYIFLLLLIQVQEMGGGHVDKTGHNGRTSMIIFPLIVSIVYVTHPALSEAVNSISYREDLLAFLFYVAALVLYLISRNSATLLNKLSFTLSCLLYILSLLSKEMAITLPIIILCYDFFYGQNKSYLRILFNYQNLVYLMITVLYIYLRFHIFKFPTPLELESWSFTEKILTLPWLISNYLYLLIAPISLSADYVFLPIKSVTSAKFIGSVITISVLLLLTFIVGKKDKKAIFGCLFFFITLSPVYNLYPLSIPFAERFLYIPAVGFIILTGTLIHLFQNYIAKSWLSLYLTVSLITIFVSMNSLLVIRRNMVWQNEYALWSDTVKKVPASYQAHFGLGNAYFDQGKFDAAVTEFMKALIQKPGDPDTHLNIGNAYLQQHRPDAAIPEYLTALRYRPNCSDAHFSLGNAYIMLDRIEEAVNEYSAALNLNYNNVFAHYKLGEAYYRLGRLKEARKEYAIVSELRPGMRIGHDLDAPYNHNWDNNTLKK